MKIIQNISIVNWSSDRHSHFKRKTNYCRSAAVAAWFQKYTAHFGITATWKSRLRAKTCNIAKLQFSWGATNHQSLSSIFEPYYSSRYKRVWNIAWLEAPYFIQSDYNFRRQWDMQFTLNFFVSTVIAFITFNQTWWIRQKHVTQFRYFTATAREADVPP